MKTTNELIQEVKPYPYVFNNEIYRVADITNTHNILIRILHSLAILKRSIDSNTIGNWQELENLGKLLTMPTIDLSELAPEGHKLFMTFRQWNYAINPFRSIMKEPSFNNTSLIKPIPNNTIRFDDGIVYCHKIDSPLSLNKAFFILAGFNHNQSQSQLSIKDLNISNNKIIDNVAYLFEYELKQDKVKPKLFLDWAVDSGFLIENLTMLQKIKKYWKQIITVVVGSSGVVGIITKFNELKTFVCNFLSLFK